MFETLAHLEEALHDILQIDNDTVIILNPSLFQEIRIDQLINTALFSSDNQTQQKAREIIKKAAETLGIFSASIRDLYTAIGKDEGEKTFTVPAMNIRVLTYDTTRIVFRVAKEKNIGPFIFEISRGEMDYTHQRPEAYACTILAAAIKEGYKGPVFLQGDHFQFSETHYKENPEEEQGKLKKLIDESIAAQFYNIDIDASTLVDLTKENLDDQQKENYKNTALLTTYIREHQPKDIIISIGGEIGHIGDRNSTVEDFEAFMQGYLPLISSQFGLSKISVQTGTNHGGTPLPDGSVKQVDLDFSVLKNIGGVARQKYHIGGAVQHGASTLPNDMFHLFPENKTLEIHLATGFQNIVYDHMPYEMKQTIYAWIDLNLQKEKKEEWTHEQFIYKTRKKALGPFEQALGEMRAEEKKSILEALEKELRFLFENFGVFETRDVVDKYIK